MDGRWRLSTTTVAASAAAGGEGYSYFMVSGPVGVGRYKNLSPTSLNSIPVYEIKIFLGGKTCSIGHPPHSSASPGKLRLRVGPRALSGKKNNLGNRG